MKLCLKSNIFLRENIVDVSVIIPTYNSRKTIEKTIESINLQTVKPLEIIIVDDCSSDTRQKNLLRVIQKNNSNINVVFLNKNQGPSTARNIGWKIAKGKYVTFLDSDDIWHPQKLEIQYKYMETNVEVDFLCCPKKVIKNKNIIDFYNIKIDEKIKYITLNPIRLLFKTAGSTSSVMLRRNIKHRFLDGKKYSEDYLLWLEILFTHKGVLLNKALVASFKELYGEAGLSSNLWKMEKGELETYTILRKKGYINFKLMCMAYTFSLFKYVRRYLKCNVFKQEKI